MPWEGTKKQHNELWHALDQVLQQQGIPAQRLAATINADKLARESLASWGDGRGPQAQVIDDGTLTRWHAGGVTAVERARQHKKAVIYEFFERSAQPRTLLYRPQEGWPQGLTEFAAEFGEQLRKPLTKDLSDLDGSYRIFQPAWTIGAMRSQRVLISRLKISTSGGFTRFTEAQQFTDPDAPSISVDEVTDGAVLYLSGNIVLFSISRQTQSCMFYTAWSTFPVPGDGTPVNRLRGSMMGIVGAGPHNSSPFVAYRSKEPYDQIETGIVRPGHKLLAPDILEWLGIEV